jgi:diketogulonate reductase-like aldo/keto reductase
MRLLYQQGIIFVTYDLCFLSAQTTAQLDPISTTNKESRIKEYFDALDVPELTSEEIQAISEAGSQRNAFGNIVA